MARVSSHRINNSHHRVHVKLGSNEVQQSGKLLGLELGSPTLATSIADADHKQALAGSAVSRASRSGISRKQGVHCRPIHFRYWLSHRVRPLSRARCYRTDNRRRAVGVTTNIQPHCRPVECCGAASRGLSPLLRTGIPSAGPFLLERGEVFEQGADPCRLSQVLVMQQPSVPPVSRGDSGQQDELLVLLGEKTRQRCDTQFIGHCHGAGCDAVNQVSAF